MSALELFDATPLRPEPESPAIGMVVRLDRDIDRPVSRQYCDHSAWQSPSCRRAALRHVQRAWRVGPQSHVGLRYRDDEAIRRVANHHLAPGDEARRRCPARVGNRAMIKISLSVTNDSPEGQPWP